MKAIAITNQGLENITKLEVKEILKLENQPKPKPRRYRIRADGPRKK